MNFWTETLPDNFTEAEVASIFKKVDTENAEHYRHLSKLNTIYKVYAIIIKNRIEKALEPVLSKVQYAFRKSRSTANPIHIVRRLQEFSEAGKDTLILTLLDWEKAFDKVSHEGLLHALIRIGLPGKMMKVIVAFYESPKFRTSNGSRKSSYTN